MDTNRQISFFIPMRIPTKTFQAKKLAVRNGKPVLYTPPELIKIQQEYISRLTKVAPKNSFPGPVWLKIAFCFKSDEKHQPGIPKPTKPDLDNLEKGLVDCMTKCNFWNDDSQICLEYISKSYEIHEGIYIEVIQL